MTATLPGLPAQETRHPDDPPASILLVDDRPENLLALEAILEPLGQRLVRALSGDEALKHLLRQDFAVILLDVQMPGLNGFETAKLIKSRERTRYIPIIFLTAISKEASYVFEGYSVGAVDYMSKPFQPDVLRSKVSVFVDLYRKQEQLKRQEQMLREASVREVELRHRAEMVESEARMAEILGSAMDAIIAFDGECRITLFNGAAERMFGAPSAEMIGRSIGELFPEDERDRLVGELCGVAVVPAEDGGADGEKALHTLVGLRRDGERFPVEASASRLDIGGTRTYTLIARDVSERRRDEEALRTQALSLEQASRELTAANEALQERQRELERAMTARNRFYASMSHELRTPINAIIGYNTLLLDHSYGPLNERQTHGLQRTHKAAKHLLELVNDVLDLSKIEAGKIELTLQPVNFPVTIEDLFVTVRPLADEHGSALELRWEGEARAVVTDPRRVRQILLNLLSNAIKFGEGKPIEVRGAATPEGGVEVAVHDHGDGIDPADLPRIFDEFVQLANSQQLGGTGLGLPISKRLARLLGGDLEVESERGRGSTFRLTLPESMMVDGQTRETVAL